MKTFFYRLWKFTFRRQIAKLEAAREAEVLKAIRVGINVNGVLQESLSVHDLQNVAQSKHITVFIAFDKRRQIDWYISFNPGHHPQALEINQWWGKL